MAVPCCSSILLFPATSIPEFEKGGESARAAIEGIQFEIDYFEPFVPKALDEAQTREIVRQAVAALGNPPPQKSGMVIGHISSVSPTWIVSGLLLMSA